MTHKDTGVLAFSRQVLTVLSHFQLCPGRLWAAGFRDWSSALLLFQCLVQDSNTGNSSSRNKWKVSNIFWYVFGKMMVWQTVNVISHQYKVDTDSRHEKRAKVHLVWCWVQHFTHVSGSVLEVLWKVHFKCTTKCSELTHWRRIYIKILERSELTEGAWEKLEEPFAHEQN